MSSFMAFMIAVTLAVLFGSIYYTRDARARRKLAATPVQAIGAVGPAMLARLTGTIQRLEGQLVAPLSGRSCVYYLAIVEEYRSRGKSGEWVVVVHEEKHVDFLIDDGSGVAQVRMDVPHAVVVRDHNTRSGTFDDATPTETAFLEQHGRDSTGFLGFNRSLRYSEGVLEFGERITVLGRTRPGKGAVRLVIDAPVGEPLLLTDHPRTVQARPA